MEYKYLCVGYSQAYFNVSAFEHYDEALAEWGTVLAKYEADKVSASERNATRKAGWEEFLALKKKYHVELSTRSMNTLKSAFIPSYASASMPSLWAWYKIGDEIVRADPNNGYSNNFERAFELAKSYYEKSKILDAEHKNTIKKAVEYCIANNLDWEIGNVYNVAYIHMADKLREELQGKTIEIDCCDECSHWTVGERRCSCGNRRVSLEIDGTFPNLYYYGEAY